jgi:hypothetical protein
MSDVVDEKQLAHQVEHLESGKFETSQRAGDLNLLDDHGNTRRIPIPGLVLLVQYLQPCARRGRGSHHPSVHGDVSPAGQDTRADCQLVDLSECDNGCR